jgi:phosphoglycerate dehydrogenase-like enzyme
VRGRLVCLPFDDWADHLSVVPSLEVVVWRPGLPPVTDPAAVGFYVPQYMGPPEALEVLARLPGLEVVQTLTAGYDDVLALLPDTVTLCNARGVHDASTAELAVGLVLASLRGIPEFVRAQRRGQWAHLARPALADRTVVVVGAGSVGRAIAERLAPFEVTVTLVGRTARDGVLGRASLEDLLPTADVVVLAVPLTPDTRDMVDGGFLQRMKDQALLVNVSRGPVVRTEALLRELLAERLWAALDVTDPEPLPQGHPLWKAPQLLLSPHVGGDTSAFLPRAWELLGRQLARYAAGQPLDNVVRRRHRGREEAP